ncbi:MAG: hypothetical protein RLY86_1080 [Pseudomonadota bacterium]|jgi:SAM-dependent methyltransferase
MTGGYVTDIAYTHGFHPGMAPGAVRLALALAGIAGPDFTAPFTWCELGFGQGVNLGVLAAAYPRARFFGCDILPAHVDHARTLGRWAAGGDGVEPANLTVTADPVGDYIQADLPPLDVVCLHGVWSWVGRGERAQIVRFLDRHLKPGGVAYLGYNALPGWSAHLPLRHLMKRHADQGTGPLDQRIRDAVAFAARIAAAGGAFGADPAVAARLADLAERPVGYLAHEYFNTAWEPMHVADLAASLAPAGLVFAAPVQPADHLDGATLPPAQRDLLAEEGDPLMRATIRDHLLNTAFRRDLFVRGPVPKAADGDLHALPFAATGPMRRVPGRLRLPQGEMALDRDLALAVMERLAQGPAAAGEIAPAAGVAVERAAAVLTALAAAGLAAPAAGDAAGGPGTAALNRHILDRTRAGNTISVLASPVLGSGVETDRVERLFLLARQQGADPVAFAAETLALRGEGLLRDGRLITGAAATQAELTERLAAFTRDRLPVLTGLGCDRGM